MCQSVCRNVCACLSVCLNDRSFSNLISIFHMHVWQFKTDPLMSRNKAFGMTAVPFTAAVLAFSKFKKDFFFRNLLWEPSRRISVLTFSKVESGKVDSYLLRSKLKSILMVSQTGLGKGIWGQFRQHFKCSFKDLKSKDNSTEFLNYAFGICVWKSCS